MNAINIHDAKTHFSRLIERASGGESFVIARAGKPVARLVPLDAPSGSPRRLGFMEPVELPEDFDRLGQAEIENLFG